MWVYATLDVSVEFWKFDGYENTEFTAYGNSKWTWYERTITSTTTTSSPQFRIDNNNSGRTIYFTGFTIRKNPSQTTGLPFTPRFSPASGRGPVLCTQTLVAREAAIKTFTENQNIFGKNFGASNIVINDIPEARWMISTGGFALRFSKHNSTSDEYSTWSEKVSIDQNGYVGIGVSPSYPLHVTGSAGSMPAMTYFVYQSSSLANGSNDNITIYADGNIYANGLVAASDERIKKDIVDADDAECLETLRLLKPKKYQYKDEINRGQEPVWGFIAQEVRETLPYATQLRKDVLPNIYELANVSQSNVITFVNFNTSNLESNATTYIRTKGIDGQDHDIHLVEVIDEHTIRVEEDLSEWIGSVDETGNVVAGNQLFIYGQEVDDFVYLKKEAIWTVATAALQEVDRQLQAEKAKVATLEQQLTSVLARLDALEGNA
jgi:hypothetical protein